MNFVESVKTVLTKYVTFSGRASRSEFWWFQLFAFVVKIVANILDSIFFHPAQAQDAANAVAETASDVAAPSADALMAASIHAGPTPVFVLIVSLGLLLPSLAVSARRLHDVNKSGWWFLLAFTIIGIIPLLIWYTKKSDDGANRFGDSPMKA